MNSYSFQATNEDFIALIQSLNQELNALLLWQDEITVAMSADLLPRLAQYSSALSVDWQRVYFYPVQGQLEALPPLILCQTFQTPQLVVIRRSQTSTLDPLCQQAEVWFPLKMPDSGRELRYHKRFFNDSNNRKNSCLQKP